MSLEKIIKVLSLTALLASCNPSPSPEETKPTTYNYTTTIKVVESQDIDDTGGTIIVNDSYSLINGTELTIPAGALQSDTKISLGEVNNPPILQSGLNYVGTPVDLEPDGMNFNNSLTIQIPYSNYSLHDAGILDDSNLKLYSYNKTSNQWEEVTNIFIDTTNKTISANINHFSYYAITGLSIPFPEDLGNPQPGDLLYATGAFWDPGNPLFKNYWMPGHVGIYVGEKIDDLGNNYNVIEAQREKNEKMSDAKIKRSYFNPINNFSNGGGYNKN